MPEETLNNEGWYNGYSWRERDRKYQVMKRRIAAGEMPAPSGACALCGDPGAVLEYHDEDYSEPYLWAEPALYALCRGCHRDKLHKRFSRPQSWFAFLAHVRRGGYGRDLKDPLIRKEVAALAEALSRGERRTLGALRPYHGQPGTEWFAKLTMDATSLTDPAARGAARAAVVPGQAT